MLCIREKHMGPVTMGTFVRNEPGEDNNGFIFYVTNSGIRPYPPFRGKRRRYKPYTLTPAEE
jgi:hypothetical protein